MSIPVKVTDASVRECVLYANLHLRGEDTNQIGTPMTVEISGAFDRWLAEHDAKVRAEALREARYAINHTRNAPSLITLADKFGGYHQGERAGLEMAEDTITRIEREAGLK